MMTPNHGVPTPASALFLSFEFLSFILFYSLYGPNDPAQAMMTTIWQQARRIASTANNVEGDNELISLSTSGDAGWIEDHLQ